MRQGVWVQNLSGDMAYRSFCPSPLPPDLHLDAELTQWIGEARGNLSELEAVTRLIPSTDLFITMYVRKEALISSQIEGTQCTLDDVLDPSVAEHANEDVADVVNYVHALQYAIQRLTELPLCNRLLRDVHAELMRGVRGQEKNPGEFRRSQNWIGAANCGLKDARYIPPNVEDMEQNMRDLERYMNEDESYDPLIRASLIHYQFETIHPFLDGNGRIGRMLVILYLMQQNLLSKPVLYVSYYLKKNQLEYYDRMAEIRKNGNYEQWVKFFLRSIAEAARDSVNMAYQLSSLRNQHLSMISEDKRSSRDLALLLEYIEQHPIMDIQHVSSALSMTFNKVSRLIKKMIEMDILSETSNRQRNRVFCYHKYLDVLRKDT
ncbi:MAG: Fic family protein [Proteobacteria bacterium]|nr:Fic family protein [Pseudomonadota bacterium]